MDQENNRHHDNDHDHDNNHRSLGRRLELFDTAVLVGAGLPLWLPAGAVIRAELEKVALEQALASGCTRVYTPVLAKRELFERSGHWEKFSEDMFPEMKVGGESFVLRPANCPHHTQVYASRGRSYRELPLRLAELGSMFRAELSGVLGGLSRVRQINLDDAHSFCREDQVADEVVLALRAIRSCYRILGIEVAHYRLSLRGAEGHYIGSDERWERAQAQLRSALAEVGVDFREAPGEAAFYGPKIDVQVVDANGREETLSTVQIDYNQPERFDLSYIDEEGRKQRPVMVHRGLLSSMERMTALLIERYDGRMPTWLAPIQVRILPVSAERHADAALRLADSLRRGGVRAEISDRGTLGARVREARDARDGYLAILGDGEAERSSVSVASPATGEKAELPVDEFVSRLAAEIQERRIRPAVLAGLTPVSSS
jgi:threonyl-tRNA synthetase